MPLLCTKCPKALDWWMVLRVNPHVDQGSASHPQPAPLFYSLLQPSGSPSSQSSNNQAHFFVLCPLPGPLLDSFLLLPVSVSLPRSGCPWPPRLISILTLHPSSCFLFLTALTDICIYLHCHLSSLWDWSPVLGEHCLPSASHYILGARSSW